MHIDQIIEYIHCPYRVKYSIESKPAFLDITNIKTIAIASLTRVFLYARYENKAMSINNLKKQLSKIWSALKAAASFEYDWEDLTKLSDFCLKLPTLFPVEHKLVAVNYPTQLEIDKQSIVGNADIITVDKENKQVLITIFDHNTKNHVEESIKATYYINAVKSDLRYLKYQLIYRHFKLNTTVLKIIDKFIDTNQLKLLSNVAKSINVYYPRLTQDICKTCIFRKTCEWKTND